MAGRGRDEVMARPGRRAAAAADPDSVGQAEAVARERERIARLTRRRAALGLSQARIARLIQTSQSAVARLESGRHDVHLSTLTRYAGAVGLSLDLVEATETPTWDSAENHGPETAGTASAEQACLEQSLRAAASHASARPEGRPEQKPESVPAMITQMPDRPDPDHVLTWRQQKVLEVIRGFVQERGYSPSIREIGEAVGLASTSSVAFQLATLQRKGYLRRSPRIVEVRLPGDPAAQPGLGPEQGQAADVPGIAIFSLPGPVVGDSALVLHKVGDSMIGAAITDGDWVVVRQRPSAQASDLRDGDLVAAEIDGVATVRTLKQSGGQVCLSPMPTLDEKVSILGRVVAVLRVGAAAL